MHKNQLADEIEKEGIERVVYGKDLTTMHWINETLLEALRSARPEGGRKYLGTFLGFKVYEDPTLEEGEFRLQNDTQLTNEMLELEKRFVPSPQLRSQEKP